MRGFKWGIFFGLGLLLFLALNGWHSSSALTPSQVPLPQDPYLQAYFNQSQASVYTEPYRKVTRYGDNLEQVIIDTLNQAQSSIDVAVHELNLPGVAQVLCDRAQAGVQVRLILENTYSRPWTGLSPSQVGELDEYRQGKYSEFISLVDQNRDGNLSEAERRQRDALYILHQAQIPLIDDTADGSRGSGLMHHKFAVIDSRIVLTGSTNWSISDIHGDFASPESRGNHNALLVINSPALASLYAEEFQEMWGDGAAKRKDSRFGKQKTYRAVRSLSLPGTTLQLQFSPTPKPQTWAQSVNGLIAKTLQQAQRKADLALFVFSEQALSNTLAQAAGRGVQVSTLIDPGFAYRDYSEGLDMLGVRMPNQKCGYEANNQPWTKPILSAGIPHLAEGDKLHHKFALIDDMTVIIGSQNWSKAANDTNDENLLVIRNPTVAAHFRREFDRLYSTADLGMTPLLQASLNKRRRACGL
ncbi:competence protein ComE [Pseudanabaena sp. FACHB-2040]|nr:competence protein ComE [Pseudanabaena sp. FACHB-2040]